MATLAHEESALHASCHAMREAGARLLARAQEAGEARADLRADELLLLAASVSWAAEHQEGDGTERLLTLLIEGTDPR